MKNFYIMCLMVILFTKIAVAVELYVSPKGDDGYPGTIEEPYATLHRAQQAVRQMIPQTDDTIKVIVRAGTYYLKNPLIFGPIDSGRDESPVIYQAYQDELVTLSGGNHLKLKWQPFEKKIFRSSIAMVGAGSIEFDQLFVNGKRQTRARYPDFDISDPGKSGYIYAGRKITREFSDPEPGPDDEMSFSSGAPRGIFFRPDNFSKKKWSRPDEAVIHIYQAHYWGNLQWRIKNIDYSTKAIWFGDGGWQMGAKWASNPCEVNEESRYFIDNVFEELDAPGEWFLDKRGGTIYFMPPKGMDINDAEFEVPVLDQLIQFTGTQNNPVRNIVFKGFRIAHTKSTYLEKYEIPSLSDWAIHRGGTVFLEGARNILIKDCWFDAVGGNAVFMNCHNRDIKVTGCKFTETGDSGVCLVGELESTIGTQRNFPYQCQVENNLFHDLGYFGKQVAAVYISRAKRITAGHNLIYDIPRAGICIGDGTWGGHIIEYNHIYNTCRETGDHGNFNSWGRDKYWCLTQSHMPYTKGRNHDAGLPLIDAMEPVILRHNFFEDDAGWGLDLDDGAANYEIYNNLCVGVSMKLREGAYRTIYNNIWVNGANSPCFHVGYENNHDKYYNNITVTSIEHTNPESDLNFEMAESYGEVYTLIAPPVWTPWLEEIDYNCFYSDLGEFVARVHERWDADYESDEWDDQGNRIKYSLKEWQKLGFDKHSVFADPMFIDPENNDYRVKPESPALKLGFKNFEMGEWGLREDFPERWREK